MFRIQRDDENWDTDWKQGSFGPTVKDHTSTAINHNSLPATYPVANGNLGNWIIPGYVSGSITVVFNEKENSVNISGTDIIVSDYTMPEKLYIRGYLNDGIWGSPIELTKDGRKYTATDVTFVKAADDNPVSYFRFFTTNVEGENWSTINSNDQYAALAPNTTVNAYTAADFALYSGAGADGKKFPPRCMPTKTIFRWLPAPTTSRSISTNANSS